jgi:glyoxylase-like metal-dependent hydrolase (beta-lactamase superfamily II)
VVDISEVAECIYMIDNQIYNIPGWGSVYLINEDKKALVDTGTATCTGTILDGIKKVGVRPEDIDYLLITHIHLDHAGGAGILIQDMPKAQVLVHRKGAKHLVNPARLMRSAIEAQGEEVIIRNGEMVPIEANRVRPIDDGETLRLSEKQSLRFINAPGHAPHEICIYESRNKGLFIGDAVGRYVAEGEVVFPVTPLPDWDSELYIDTLQRLMELKASRLYFPHFGVTSKVQKVLGLAIHKIRVWDDIVTKAMREDNLGAVEERMVAQLYKDIEPMKKREYLYRYMIDYGVPINVAGFMKYHQSMNRVEKRRSCESNQGED